VEIKVMSLQEVLNEIYKMPLTEQQSIVKTLTLKLERKGEKQSFFQSEIYQQLFKKGLITHIPSGMQDSEDDFIPAKTDGEPLSEMIMRERR
jgi:hypothetical protein